MSKLNQLFDPLVDYVEMRVKPEEKQEPTSETELVERKGRLENKKETL